MGNNIIYAYKTKEKNYEEIFTNGIVFYDSEELKMEDYFDLVPQEDLDDYLREIDCNTCVFFVEVPRNYIKGASYNGKRIPPYPMLYERETINPDNGKLDYYPVVVPCVISGMYNQKSGLLKNANYSLAYNPCGLRYTWKQMVNVRRDMTEEEAEILINRNKSSDLISLYCAETQEEKKLGKKDNKGNIITNWTFKSLLDAHGITTKTEPFAVGDLTKVEVEAKKEKKDKNKKDKKLKPKKNKPKRHYDIEDEEYY